MRLLGKIFAYTVAGLFAAMIGGMGLLFIYSALQEGNERLDRAIEAPANR